MKSLRGIFVFLIALICFSGSAFATTYCVATTGNDGNPGTSIQPWATLQHAVQTIAPGDMIIVRAGTYVGCRIEQSGQPGALKTLQADAGATVVINAPGPANKRSSNIEVELFNSTVTY